MTILFCLAVLTAILYALISLDVVNGNRSVRSLHDVAATPPPVAPLVSVITAARNEERNIREALGSLLALDYPNIELIAVNDRSEDKTCTILTQMAAEYPHLNVIHVTELPTG